ncbi:MAG: tripartite tricarboxylate transporter substrate binding protein [Burkholderiaceae bacterium]
MFLLPRLYLLLLGMSLGLAQAQGFPNKPVKIVVSFTAGGTTDILAREMAQRLSVKLGQSFVVDNKPGAAGNIGTEIVARSPADGYTLLASSIGPMAVNPTLFRKLAVNPLTELIPISPLADVPNVLVVHPSLPVKTLNEFLAYAKTQDGKLSYPSTGVGTASHISGVMLQKHVGVTMTHIPYKGAVALTDLIAGRTQFMVATAPSVLQHIRTGQLRALAVTSEKRAKALPEVPTTMESGLQLMGSWFGIFAPKGTPPAIVAQLNQAMSEIQRSPDMIEKISSHGAEAVSATAAQYGAFVMKEYQTLKPIVLESGAVVD